MGSVTEIPKHGKPYGVGSICIGQERTRWSSFCVYLLLFSVLYYDYNKHVNAMNCRMCVSHQLLLCNHCLLEPYRVWYYALREGVASKCWQWMSMLWMG